MVGPIIMEDQYVRGGVCKGKNDLIVSDAESSYLDVLYG